MDELVRILGIPATIYGGIYLTGRILPDRSGLSNRELAQYKIKIDKSSGFKKAAYILSGIRGSVTDEIFHRKMTEKGFKEEYKSEIDSLMKL